MNLDLENRSFIFNVKIITSPCQCNLWDKIGAKNITEARYEDIYWFTDKQKAILMWIYLSSSDHTCWMEGIPYFWAVHLNGEHIVNIIV